MCLTKCACWGQSLTSRALGADLHPAARFGKGVFLAHPIGEGCTLNVVLLWIT